MIKPKINKFFDINKYIIFLLSRNSILILAFFTLCHFFSIFLFSISRHYALITNINDLGVFDQAIWGMLNKLPFHNSFLFDESINILSFHFFPIISIFAPLYFFYATPLWLLLVQSICLSFTSFLIYYLCRMLIFSKSIALAFSLIYLLDFRIANTAFFDFHEISIAIPFFALAFIAIEKRNFLLFIISLLVISLCKEHFGLSISAFGILWYIKNKDIYKGSIVFLFGIVHTAIILFWLMPFLSNYGQHIMLVDNMGQLSRYGWIKEYYIKLGSRSIFPIIRNLLKYLNFFQYFSSLLLPFLFIPILGVKFLLPGISDLVANSFSANPMPRSLFAYHNATLSIIFLVSCIYSTPKFCNKIKRFSVKEIVFLLLLLNVVSFYMLTPFPLPHSIIIWDSKNYPLREDFNISSIKNIVKNDSISVQANIGSYFTHRKKVHIFPNNINEVKYIVLNLYNPLEKSAGTDPKHLGTLGHCLNTSPKNYIDILREIVTSNKGSIVYWNDPWLVIDNAKSDHKHKKDVLRKIYLLEIEWFNE